jgi:hypothetical protein
VLLEGDAEEERTELGREVDGELARAEEEREVEFDGPLRRGAGRDAEGLEEREGD